MSPLRGDRARARTHQRRKQGEELGSSAHLSWVPGGQGQLAVMYTVANLGCFPSFASDAELLVCKHCCLPVGSWSISAATLH